MNHPQKFIRPAILAVGIASLLSFAPCASAALSFLGVASGDTSNNEAILWTRAVDASAPAAATVTLQYSTDPTFATGVSTASGMTDPAKDYTIKLDVTGLSSATRYYYRFVGPASEVSNVGTFKTAPAPTTAAPLHFGFSGDCDGLTRPYALTSQVPGKQLDFFMFDGDTIYETASSGSAAATSTGNLPAPSSTGATSTQLFTDYSRKYREQFLPVNSGGQNCLQSFFAGQANYTASDNHELGNKQYINGGAPAGGAVGNFTSGAGVDARVNTNDVNTSGTFMNKAGGFLTLQQVYLNYQPVKEDRASGGTISAPSDPNTNGTKQLYFAQSWGKNAIFVNTDCRSYRDIRIKKASDGSDDTTSPRANNASRTYLGATQLAWLEQTLLNAQNAGTPWKFVNLSDPIDQLGPIGGALSLSNLPSFGAGSTYAPVSADGGKAWQGGYRAERNALLKFIADHQITNVVFLATDDHQNRVNEITYSPSGQTELQSSYVKVPYCFEIVCGPLGATGPDLITNHTFSMAKQLADSIANAQTAAGVEPLGLAGYPGLHDVTRLGDPQADTLRQPVDFYSPDTFNYNTLDISADGKTLTVKSYGINSTAQNSFLEYDAANNPEQLLFSFQVDSASPLSSIDHIIVVYQENWSFDALYGTFPGANGRANASTATLDQKDRVTGNSLSSLTGNFNIATRTSPTLQAPNPQPIDTNNGNIVDTRFSSSLNTLLPFNVANSVASTDRTGDIVHKYWQEMFQIFGALSNGTDLMNNRGFITWSDNPGLVMSYYDATSFPEGLLAQQYTMCDNFYHSAFGGSFLNHQFLISAAPPVYPSMPTDNNGAIGYVDNTGLFALNSSGSSAGKVIRDGSITPMFGDSLTGLTINGVSGQSATVGASGTPSDVSFQDGSHFDKHYVVNTTFTANLCPTFSNFGTSALMPSLNNTNPAGVEYRQNIGDLLDNAGVSWKWYSGGWDKALAASKSNPLHLGSSGPIAADANFQWHHQAFAYFEKSKPFDAAQTDGLALYAKAHLQDEAAHLYSDITNNTLPTVSFVKFLGDNNEHPGYAALQTGQQHVADLVSAVQANPALWAHTAIIVTYDEHGGRWDHVTPPTRDLWGPGVRVPAIVISPLARKGYIDSVARDTSSVLSTIEQRFGLPALNQRDANAPSFFDVFTALDIARAGFVRDRRTGNLSQVVTITNRANTPIVGPIQLVLDNATAVLTNANGMTANNAPTGSRFITASAGNLAPGASVTVTLQFTPPASGGVTYSARTVTGTPNP